MKEKFKQIMIKGGFSVLIAVVAMSLYLTAMHFANKYFEDITQPAEITVNENGEIKIEGFETEKDEVIYILWETDAGNIKPVKENPAFEEQNKIENNKWYYANTNIDEGVVWDSMDADGNEYTTATIKAVIYSYNEADDKDQYYMGNYVNEMTITVTKNNDKIEKASDRYFSNPVRKDSEDEWNQIYMISEDADGNQTYRFRTGKKIEEEILILAWESDKNILSETDYEKGLYPKCQMSELNKDKNMILTKNTITINTNEAKSANISAYLIDEDAYENADKGIEEKEKLYKAELRIE